MLTSLQNPLVKQIRKLHSAKERRVQGVFLLEGTHLLQEACVVNYPLLIACCTPEWEKKHQSLWQQACQHAQRTEIVSSEVLKAIATTVQPDGVVATAAKNTHQTQIPQNGLALALETIQDPGNVGTIIRTATAAGASGLWLSTDSVDIYNPKVLRATAGQWFRLPMAVTDLSATVQAYKQAGIQVVATLADASRTYWEVDWQLPSLILLGNEGAGLSEQLVTQSEVQVRIPQNAAVESLNVAIAAALMLYEAQRQKTFAQ